MPELPEVETTKRQIAPFLTGQVIARIIVRNGNLRAPVSRRLKTLRAEKIKRLQRRAKYLCIELDCGFIIIHLGMTGYLRLVTAAEPVSKHDHVDLVLTGGKILRYNDARRFGLWEWVDDISKYRRFANLGPEPLSPDFTAAYLLQLARHKTRTIKSMLMDAAVVVGVGNIYANEALFAAKIHPARAAGSLTAGEAAVLAAKVREILTAAIAAGGTTISDFQRPDGQPGYFSQELQIYGREKNSCPVCGTKIEVIKIAGRASFYCPVCQ